MVVGLVGYMQLQSSYCCALLTFNWTKRLYFITYSPYTVALCKI